MSTGTAASPPCDRASRASGVAPFGSVALMKTNTRSTLREVRPQQRIAGADQPTRVRRNEAGISVFGFAPCILIEQQVAIVRPVGEVVDDHDLGRRRTHRLLPASIERVMIDDKPIERFAQCGERRLRVGAPCRGEPVATRRDLLRRIERQNPNLVPPPLDHPPPRRRRRRAEENDCGAPRFQRIGERQAAGEMAKAQLARGVDANADAQHAVTAP